MGCFVAGLSLLTVLLLAGPGQAYERRQASLAELRSRYQALKLCVIELLAQNSSQLLPIRVAELSELLTEPKCINKSLAQSWIELLTKNETHTIVGSDIYSHQIYLAKTFVMNHAPRRCYMSDVDRVQFWTSAWDIPATHLTTEPTAVKLWKTLLAHNKTKIQLWGDSMTSQVILLKDFFVLMMSIIQLLEISMILNCNSVAYSIR
jgi:hypothetical protein